VVAIAGAFSGRGVLVQPLLQLPQAFGERTNLADISYINRYDASLAAMLHNSGPNLVELFPPPADQHNVRPGAGKRCGKRFADPLPRPSDDDEAVVEAE
jgi:hypothetical protein